MRRFLLDVYWVAGYEVQEALRTRLFQILLLAWCGMTGFSNWLLFKLLSSAESRLAISMGVPTTKKPGAMMEKLMESGQILNIVGDLVGDKQAARQLLDTPVLALWAGATTMVALPMLMLFTSAGSVASEVRSRSIRYLLCRVGRLQVVLGKMLGQLGIASVVLAAGGGVTFAMGMGMMVGNPPLALLVGIADRSLRAMVWSLPFAGVGMAASLMTSAPNSARLVCGGGLFVLTGVWAWVNDKVDGASGQRWVDMVGGLLPGINWADWWRVDPGTVGGAAAQSVVLVLLYVSAGLARFRGRDL